MKVSVLINNYNYQPYVVDAIESVLNQSVPADEIIVVDDKSTDQSAQLLQEKFGNHERVKLILKDQNEGQLASFQSGFAAAQGDIICFLDADDLYQENYIAEIIKAYKERPTCDFLFCSAELFGNEQRIVKCYETDRDLGYSQITTLCKRTWIGHRTSTLSVRRQVLEQLFPIPYLEDWRLRADDCLVFGASIVGAHKFYLVEPLVKYRVHGHNGHYGQVQKRTPEYLQKYEAALDRLFTFLAKQINHPNNLCEQAAVEFRTIPHPSAQELQTVKAVIRGCKTSRLKRLTMRLSVHSHFLMHRLS
ncbi:glycosyltransferase family 2 protein [Phormidesmis sp. 146-12]